MLAAVPARYDCASPEAAAPREDSLPNWFDAMQRAEWSRRQGERSLPHVLAIADTLHPAQRTAWLAGLRRMWRSQAWALPEARLSEFVALTFAWGDWPLTIAAGEALAARRPLTAHEDRSLVVASRQMGDLTTAVARCRSRMFAHPRESWPEAEYHALLDMHEFRQSVPPIVAQSGLRLEPLGHHHAQDFATQYYDPDIAELCCLPTFTQDAQWHCWLDTCWGYGDQRLYAVIEPEWGFVGCVSLIAHDDVGFFYYWIGRDFQGCGLGTAAVRLLLEDAAECHGTRACYAKVFEHNAPSRRALEKLGFAELDFRPAPPDDDELLYRCGPLQPRDRNVADLRDLFERMQSGTRIAVPIAVFEPRMRYG
jgi:RimJ/RimL family protein N-acetyltransferase